MMLDRHNNARKKREKLAAKKAGPAAPQQQQHSSEEPEGGAAALHSAGEDSAADDAAVLDVIVRSTSAPHIPAPSAEGSTWRVLRLPPSQPLAARVTTYAVYAKYCPLYLDPAALLAWCGLIARYIFSTRSRLFVFQ